MSKQILWSLVILFTLPGVACQSGEQEKQPPPAKPVDPAIERITRQIDQKPDDPSLYVARAQVYHQMENYDQAVKDMDKAIELDTTRFENFLYLAKIFLDYGHSRDALIVLDNAARRFPDNLKVALTRAHTYYIVKQYRQSTDAINKILSRDPQNAQAYFLLGLNYKELGDTTRAINAFQKAVDLDADILDAWINLGNLWTAKGGFAIANKYFESALAIDSNNVYVLNSYALALGKQDKYPESIRLYKKIARLDPQFSDGFFNAGIMYLMMDSVRQANRQFNMAVQTSPAFAKAYYYRGYTFERLGDTARAHTDYDDALRFDPDLTKARQALDRLVGRSND